MTPAEKMLKKAWQDLQKEQEVQLGIIYCATAIALLGRKGWDRNRLLKVFSGSQTAWQECAEHGIHKSIMQMLEEETGADFRLEGMPDWHEIAYFNEGAWDRKPQSPAQRAYMYQQQKKWLGTAILAAICIGAHRSEGWEAMGISRLVRQVDGIRRRLGSDPEAYRQELLNRHGMRLEDIMTQW